MVKTRKKKGGGLFNWFRPKQQKTPANVINWAPTEAQLKHENRTTANTQGLKPNTGFFGKLFTRKVKPVYNRYSPTGNKEKNEYLKEFYRKVQSNQLSNPNPNLVSAYPLPSTLNISNTNLNKLNKLENAEFGASSNVRVSNYLMPGETQKPTRKNSIPIISLKQGLEYAFVFAYLKYKGLPLDPTILRLTSDQKTELRNALQSYDSKDINTFAKEVFHTTVDQFDNELQAWEKHNEPIQFGNRQMLGQSYAGYLGRLVPHILRSERDEQYLYNTNMMYQCSGNTSTSLNAKNIHNNCIAVYGSLQKYIDFHEGHYDKLYIVVNIPFLASSAVTLKSEAFLDSSFILDSFAHKNVLLIHPRLGWILQKQYLELWALSYKLDYLDDVDRIVLLTLQKYAVLRRYEWTHEPSWCSDVYTHSYKEPYMAYELLNPQLGFDGYNFDMNEFQQEFIANQKWAGKVKYKSLDAITFLPTIPGFQPEFPWKVLELKRAQEVKHPQGRRHANALRNIARTSGSKLAALQANAWNTLNRLSYPHIITPEQEAQYKKNYGLHIGIPNNTANTIFTNSNSLALSNTPLSNSNIVSPVANLSSPRATFPPTYTRRIRRK